MDFLKNRTLLATAFWVAYILTISIVLSAYEGIERAVIVSAAAVAFQMVIVYANILLFIPALFEKRRYVLYGASILSIIAVLVVIRSQVVIKSHMMDYMRGDNLRVTVKGKRLVFFGSFLTMAYALSTAYYFIAEWFRNSRLQAELRLQQVETELKYLKNQIDPHFLFNTLNNIYTLCYLKDDKAPLAVMKLSDMMRYSLTDSNSQTVELQREIDFIQDYLELQKLKSETPVMIEFDIEGVKGRHRIAPMLLIIFFENCFKHGNVGTDPGGWMKAKLSVNEQNVMEFKIRNSKRNDAPRLKEASHLGLDNVMRRMSIQYKNRHSLDISETDREYLVHLTLGLDS